MVLWQEHVPQSQLLRAFLEILEDGRVGAEAFLNAGAHADLLLEDGVGGDAFFVDEFLNLSLRYTH